MKTALILLIQNMAKKEIDIINMKSKIVQWQRKRVPSYDILFMYNDLNMKIK